MKKKLLYTMALAGVTVCLFGCKIHGNPQTTEPESASPVYEVVSVLPEDSVVETSEKISIPDGNWVEPTPDPNAEEPRGVIQTDPYEPDGFSTKDPLSFAARAEGVYEMKGNTSTKLELYAVGGNLYGFVDTEDSGFAAIELYADDGDFASHKANNLDVAVLTFSIQSNLSKYWGSPATYNMELTEDGIQFIDLDSGNPAMFETATFIRTDEKMGNLDAFCYRAEDYSVDKVCSKKLSHDYPSEIIGMWRILGDKVAAPMIEFTEDGLVQVYLANPGEEVLLYRGNYGILPESDHGEIWIKAVMQGLGYGSSPNIYNLAVTVTSDGNLSCEDSGEGDGEDMFWDGAMLIPIDESSLDVITEREVSSKDYSSNNIYE